MTLHDHIERVGRAVINRKTRELLQPSDAHLPPLAFRLLEYFIDHPNRLVTREELLEEVWNLPPDIEGRRTDRQITYIRRAIEHDATDPEYLLTVYGRGWRLNSDPDHDPTQPMIRCELYPTLLHADTEGSDPLHRIDLPTVPERGDLITVQDETNAPSKRYSIQAVQHLHTPKKNLVQLAVEAKK